MATKHHSNNEDDFKEVDELEDSEIPEMGEEGILMPKNSEDMEFDDTDTETEPEEAPEITEEE